MQDLNKFLCDCRNFVRRCTRSSSSDDQILQTRVFKECVMFVSNTCTWFDTFRKQLSVFYGCWGLFWQALHWKLESQTAQLSAAPAHELFCSKLSHTSLLYPAACRISTVLTSHGKGKGKERGNVCDLRMCHYGSESLGAVLAQRRFELITSSVIFVCYINRYQ